MEINSITIATFVLGVLVSCALLYIILLKRNKNIISQAKSEAETVVFNGKKEAKILIKNAEVEAEALKKNKIFQAKEKFLELKDKHEQFIVEKNKQIQGYEKRIKQKEQKINTHLEQIKSQTEELKEMKTSYQDRLRSINVKQKELEKKYNRHIEELEKISGLSTDEAKEQLLEELKDEAKNNAINQIQAIVEEAELSAKNEAKKIVIQTIQRIGTEQAIENAVSVFNIESDDIKGRIIGREGRNIRAFESVTGVELIVDDTPEAIILSCFDPVRREIARLSLHRLIVDGRIHPARIEEIVRKTTKQLEDEIAEVGKRTVTELNISGLHPKLVRIVGRMKYRSSYGQNLLHHSKEVARLSATMAAELGLNPKDAKRAGLLHDIGKVPETESEVPHALLGMQWAEKYGEKPDVCNAIGAHHDEIEMTCLLSPVVQVCDAISGARPGARRQIMDLYLKRIRDLEDLALSFEGVNKSYAIQAGKELRVIVESEKVSDRQAKQLSIEISQKIQTEMTYPGQVRVTVIRETRAVNIAR